MRFFTVILLVLLLLGCSGSKKMTATGEDDKHKDELSAKGVGLLTFYGNDFHTRKVDTNKDDITDIYTTYKISKDESDNRVETVYVKQIDLNHDGKIDDWRFYNDEGQISKEELDFDFDGKVDETRYYTAGVVTEKAMGYKFDEKPEVWKFYDNKGFLIRMEADQDGDEAVDFWEYYEKGVLERVEKDTDKDGKADIFKRAGDISFSPILTNANVFSEEDTKKEETKKIETPDTANENDADIIEETSDADVIKNTADSDIIENSSDKKPIEKPDSDMETTPEKAQ